MIRFLPTARQLRKLMVVVPLTIIIAIPVLSQPLGLFDAWNDSTAESQTETAQPTDPIQETPSLPTETTTPGFDHDEFADMHDFLFDRGRNTTATTSQVPDDDTAVTEVPAETTAAEIVFVDADHLLYVSAGPLNVRAGPSTDHEIVGRLSFGDKVTCTGVGDEWMRIDYNGGTAYIFAEHTSTTMVFEDVSQTVFVTAGPLNLRAGPSTDDSIITRLSTNTRLTRTGIGDGWSRVRTASGQAGYVSNQFLTRTAPAIASSPSGSSGATFSGSASEVAALANSVLGVRYVWGGESTNGFDCSGLIYWIYRQIGIRVPRISYDYGRVGVSVSRSSIQPGDIICIDHRKIGRAHV